MEGRVAQVRAREEVCEEGSGAVGGRRAVRAPLTKGSVSVLILAVAELSAKRSSKLFAVCRSFQADVVGRGTAGVKKRVCLQAVPRPS